MFAKGGACAREGRCFAWRGGEEIKKRCIRISFLEPLARLELATYALRMRYNGIAWCVSFTGCKGTTLFGNSKRFAVFFNEKVGWGYKKGLSGGKIRHFVRF